MKIKLLKFLLITVVPVVFAACERDDPETESASLQASAESESVMDEMDSEVLLRTTEVGYAESTTGCPTVTYLNTAGTFPNTITIDWGTGCTGLDGRFREGAIVVDVTGPHFSAGSVRTMTSQGYAVDNWEVGGVRTVTNLGTNANDQMQWNIVENNASITDPDGDVGTWTSDRTRTLVSGGNTVTMGDNSGSIVSAGRLNRTHTLDYGQGACDDQATLTFANGNSRSITLRR